MPLMGFPCGAFLFLAQLVGKKFSKCNRRNCHKSGFGDMQLKMYRVRNEGKPRCMQIKDRIAGQLGALRASVFVNKEWR